MLNLYIHSWFRPEFKVGKLKEMPQFISEIVYKIEQEEPVNGRIFRPTPDFSYFQAIAFPIGALALFLFFLWVSGSSIFSMSSLLLFFIFIPFALYLSLFERYFAPKYVEKHLDQFFVYIGEEGIIKKSRNDVAFIPYDSLKSTRAFVINGNDVSLSLETKKGNLFNPNLLTINGKYLIFDLADYSTYDIRNMVDLINQYIKRQNLR